MELTEALQWRYAAKRMNGRTVAPAQLNPILEAIRLAPSSRGLQPYQVLVVSSSELKSQIQPIADHQPQVVECSHLLILAVWNHVTQVQIEQFIAYAAKERGISVDKLAKIKAMLINEQLVMTPDEFQVWAAKQAYLALGFALTAAAVAQVDATPMEGFDPKALDKLLNLETQGLKSTVLLALGYRDVQQDWLAALKKVRRNAQELFVYL